MKKEILRLLNQQRNEAETSAERAKRDNDLVGLLANNKFIDLLGRLIKTIQDHY